MLTGRSEKCRDPQRPGEATCFLSRPQFPVVLIPGQTHRLHFRHNRIKAESKPREGAATSCATWLIFFAKVCREAGAIRLLTPTNQPHLSAIQTADTLNTNDSITISILHTDIQQVFWFFFEREGG
jgi:hypothetical protein